jgi:hypothetical protein
MSDRSLRERSRRRGVRFEPRGPGRVRVHGDADYVRASLDRWLHDEVRSWCQEVRDV